MQHKFFTNEIDFAYLVVNIFILEKVNWVLPPNQYESLFIIDKKLNVLDVSKARYPHKVTPCAEKFSEIGGRKFVTVHNHPTGRIYPSTADWEFALWIQESIYRKCMFHIIINPSADKACMFNYGKGVYEF